MSPQIQFQAGQPKTYIATRSFALGNSGMNIQAGSELAFDGTHVTYAGSNPVVMPQLRGAVKAGWIVLQENYDPTDLSASIPRPAGVQVRAANGGNPMDPPVRTTIATADAEEREVGNVAAHAQQTRQANANFRPGQRSSATTVESQEGVPVRTLSTPTRFETNLEKTSVAEAVSQAQAQSRIQAGQGRTREDVMLHMSEEERQEYQLKLESKKIQYSSGEDPEALREREANQALLDKRARLVDSQGNRVVGSIAAPKNAAREGFQITNHVGGGTETVDLSGLDTPAADQVEVIESEGMRFTTTNGPKKNIQRIQAPISAASMDTRRRIAKAICTDFPDNYEFDAPVRKKIARLQADYDDRPDVIKAVAAADTDEELRTRLFEEFPAVFA